MKRPQGFDRQATGIAASRRPKNEPGSSDVGTSGKAGNGTAREVTTEPIPVVSPTEKHLGVPDAGASATAGPSVRAASRERKRFERTEVKRFTRATRRRRRAWLIGGGAVVVVLGAAILVSISPVMALRTIDVVGADRVDAGAVQKALGDQLGKPLPFVDLADVKQDLMEYPLIRSYSTELQPPGTLVVRLVERQPIGMLKSGNQYRLVDQAGVVISRGTDRVGGYPVISPSGGTGSAGWKRGFAAATGVLASLPQSLLSSIDTITAKTPDDVAFTIRGGKSVVWGGTEDTSLKSAVLALLLKKAPSATSYDVSSPHSPVTR